MASILIVDDSPSNREYLVTLLGYSGHRLFQANDGAEALAIARSQHPGLIISDILMPTMDGYELVRQLRREPLIGHTPVIFFTAHYHEREAQALARSCGVSKVLTKPCEPEAVLQAVEEALGLVSPIPMPPAMDEFDREHLRLLTDKLLQETNDLITSNGRLNALIELNLQLGSELDIRRLLQGFGQAARQIIGAKYSITAIVSPDRTRMEYLFTSGMSAEEAARLGSPDLRHPAIKAILLENRCIRMKTASGDPAASGFAAGYPPVHSWLGAPLSSPDRTYGYICLIDKVGAQEFSLEDERLAGILAAQVGRVYQSSNLYSDALRHAADLEREVAARIKTEADLAERSRQAMLTSEVCAALTHGQTREEMLAPCAKALVKHLDASVAQIWTANAACGQFELSASAELEPEAESTASGIAHGAGKAQAIASLGKAYHTNSLAAEAALEEPAEDRQWQRRLKFTSFAGYPLLLEDRCLGVMSVYSRHDLSKASLLALESVANEIALGIERQTAAIALREREEHIRLLLDSTEEAIFGMDLQGRCSFANPACARLLGFASPELLIGRDMHEVVHRNQEVAATAASGRECRLFHSMLTNAPAHFENEAMRRQDGSEFPADYRSYPIRSKGEVVGSVAIFVDIAQRLELERRVQQAQERLQYVVSSSPAVLFTSTVADGQILGITWISDNLETVFGYPAALAVGADWWAENLHPDDHRMVMANSRLDLLTRGSSLSVYRFRHADGVYRWTRTAAKVVRDAAGKPVEVTGAFLNIDEIKKAEEEQHRLREQLEQARKMETLGRLAGGVAHDFNNLLTVINGYAELALAKLPPVEPCRAMVAEILKAGERAAELTSQLLLISRRRVSETTVVNLNEVAADVERMMSRLIHGKIEIRAALHTSPVNVLADYGRMHQLLMNLVVNAEDALEGGGVLGIETAPYRRTDADQTAGFDVPAGDYSLLRVTDNGTGMSEEVQSHLFEPFFTTKPVGEGTGMGLATVYATVKLFGGFIFAESKVGSGTSFTILLARATAEVAVRAVDLAVPLSYRGGEVILLVEDNDQLRKMTALLLQDLGYEVLQAANAIAAISISEAYANPIQLLLTDVVMPRMLGTELAKRLVARRPQMVVLFMSGYNDTPPENGIVDSGFFLSKPFTNAELAIKVREVLTRNLRGLRVMVVDDDSSTRKFLRSVLEESGLQVLEAMHGQDALRILSEASVELLITDLAMPEMEGIETIQRVRSGWPEIRIIAISGQFQGAILQSAERLGAHASLPKPITRVRLLDAVRKVLG